MEITLIAAMSENNVIGIGDNIPWRIEREDFKKYAPDMKRFVELTTPHPVIMGRKTYESIPKKFRPLENRTNIILTRSGFSEDGIVTCKTLDEALELAKQKDNEIYIAGGGEIYNQSIGREDVTKLEITEIKGNYHGDVFFPKIDSEIWKEDSRISKEYLDFVTYLRK